MNIVLAQFVSSLIAIIKDFINKFKLNFLKERLKTQEEKTNESIKKASDAYTTFMHDYNNWLDEEERRTNGPVQKSTRDVSRSSSEAADSTGKPAGDDKQTKPSNRRARPTISRRKKRSKKR